MKREQVQEIVNDTTFINYLLHRRKVKYDSAIDLSKLLASFFAVILAILNAFDFYKWPIDSGNMVLLTLINIIATAFIPLLFICTGYLMYNKKITFTHYYHLLYVLLNYVIVSLLIYSITCFFSKQTFDIVSFIIELFNYTITPNAWYMEIYICLYLLIPLLNQMWQTNKKNNSHLFILIVFFVLCCVPTIFNVYDKIFPTYCINLYPIFYYFLGVYYRTDIEKTVMDKILKQKAKYLLFIPSIISLIQNMSVLYDAKFEERIFNQYYSWPACLIAIGFFLICQKYKDKIKFKYQLHYFANLAVWTILGANMFEMIISKIVAKYSQINDLNVLLIIIVSISTWIVLNVTFGIIYYLMRLIIKGFIRITKKQDLT